MKKRLCLLLALCLLLGAMSGLVFADEAGEPELPVAETAFLTEEAPLLSALPMLPHFTDIPETAWYYEAVRQSYEQGLMSGVSTTRFGPGQRMTRAMFVTVLGRLAKVNTENYLFTPVFDDVLPGQYYTEYVIWAQTTGVVMGVSDTSFAPDDPVTREQAAAILARYIRGVQPSPEPSVPATFADTEAISEWALADVTYLQVSGLMYGDEKNCFNPQNEITRAEAAAVFVRLNKKLNGANIVNVHAWFDRDPPPQIISDEELARTAQVYGIAAGTDAYKALASINTVYAERIPVSQRKQPLLFMFEGCGMISDPNQRMDAMTVLVKNGSVVFLDRYSTTIPDYPFDPLKNDDYQPMPTMKAGIFRVTAVNHKGYAAWHVNDCAVVRFQNQNNYYESASYWIRVHRRTKDFIAPYNENWVNSCGCILVGRAGAESNDTYARFIQTIGLVAPGSAGNVPYQYDISGLFILDRAYAGAYLAAVGYPQAARKLLGCP